jgi:hypothetical protein
MNMWRNIAVLSALFFIPAAHALKEDSNSSFTEIPVNRLSLPLIGNKIVED